MRRVSKVAFTLIFTCWTASANASQFDTMSGVDFSGLHAQTPHKRSTDAANRGHKAWCQRFKLGEKIPSQPSALSSAAQR